VWPCNMWLAMPRVFRMGEGIRAYCCDVLCRNPSAARCFTKTGRVRCELCSEVAPFNVIQGAMVNLARGKRLHAPSGSSRQPATQKCTA